MASSSRKQITYAHKRNRTKPPMVKHVSESSPLTQGDDPDHYMSHSELSRRLLKRARHASNPGPSPSKKLKSAGTALESLRPDMTRHPELSVEKIPKLTSSGAHPDQLSPRHSASLNLKENASRRKRKQDNLSSPSKSRSGSNASSPQKLSIAGPSLAMRRSMSKSLKRTLSNTDYNLNITLATQPPQNRISFDPSPPRPSNWIPDPFTFNFPPHLEPPSTIIDFACPPLPETHLHFFDDAQGSSTPLAAQKQRAYTRGPVPADADADATLRDPEPQLALAPDAMDADLPPPGLRTLPARARSPWLSDSLISAPDSEEWKRAPQEYLDASLRSPAKTMLDDISLGLGLGLPAFAEGGASVEGAAEPPDAHEPAASDARDCGGAAFAAPNSIVPLTSVCGDERNSTPTGTEWNGPNEPPSSPDQLDALSSGSQLLPSPVGRPTRRTVRRTRKTTPAVVLDDEDEDELLLKPGSFMF
ncbi:hypothetical protein B0H15DRAFT_799258 [Mycena belliarum]|uniref:Uncharacterized protein n=1 Tax=Mycena belliarum TaxID=1033014 RepID=A0AAD6XUG4_9AGAR|nr:hypothetical protein B0H15DRAFT_799258 [Mycena belliae]